LGELREGPLIAERKLAAAAPSWLAEVLQTPGDANLGADERMEQTWLLAHLLNGRESERTAILWLECEEAPPDVGAWLAQRASEIRSRGADESQVPAP
jgi:hypothetical protein